jgi:Transposase IS4
MVWAGLLLYMGALEIRPTTLLWSHDLELPQHCIARFFSHKRWEDIKRYIYISSPLEPGRPVHEKVEPLVTDLGKRFRKYVTPGSCHGTDRDHERTPHQHAQVPSLQTTPNTRCAMPTVSGHIWLYLDISGTASPQPSRRSPSSSTTADPGATSSTVPSSPYHRWELATVPPRPITRSNRVGLEPDLPLTGLPVHLSQTVYTLFLFFTQRL